MGERRVLQRIRVASFFGTLFLNNRGRVGCGRDNVPRVLGVGGRGHIQRISSIRKTDLDGDIGGAWRKRNKEYQATTAIPSI